MSFFSTRQDSDVLVVTFETAAGLNDFRNNALRDSLYELVQAQPRPASPSTSPKVDYLSSSGVAILVGLKRRVETKGGQMVIYHLQPIVHDLLAIMKLDRFFTISRRRSTRRRLPASPLPRPNRFVRFPRYPAFPIFTGLMKAGGAAAPIERGVSALLR